MAENQASNSDTPADAGTAVNKTDNTAALTAIIKELKPRHRTVNAAMVFLGEGAPAAKTTMAKGGSVATDNSTRARWMEQNGVSQDELDRAFHFHDDGSFDLLDAPGSNKKEKTLNTCILTGLGKYLGASDRNFDDAAARGFCETVGCYDSANHASTLKEKGAESTGDKKKGYTPTNVGMKTGAALVKALAKRSIRLKFSPVYRSRCATRCWRPTRRSWRTTWNGGGSHPSLMAASSARRPTQSSKERLRASSRPRRSSEQHARRLPGPREGTCRPQPRWRPQSPNSHP